MSDQQPTGVSTDAGVIAAASQGSTTTSPSVNPAQAPVTQQTQATNAPQQNFQDVSGIIATYENRIRNLMSDKDKAINERNTAIAQLAQLQATYTEERARDQHSLTNLGTAAQAAISQSQTYEQQIASMQGELLRATTLLQKPHLANYAEFIPTNQNAEQMAALVARLEAVRTQDLEQNRQGYVPSPVQQQQQGQPVAFMPPASSLPNQQGATNPLNLTGQQQQNMAQLGSNPASMSPNGGANMSEQIAAMLKTALDSGNAVAYNEALNKAIAMSASAVQQQLGR